MYRLSRVLLTSLLLAAVVSACNFSSPPTHYYVLQALSERTTSQQQASLGIGPITVADYLTMPQLLTSAGGYQLQYSDFERWAEPIDKGISRVILENLSRLTASQQIYSFPWRRDEQPALLIRAKVLSLDIDAAGDAVLKVDWRIMFNTNGQRFAGEITELHQTAEPGFEGQAKAYSQLLANFSQLLAAALDQATAVTSPQ